MLSANSILFSRRRFITTISLFTLSIVILCPFVRFHFVRRIGAAAEDSEKKSKRRRRATTNSWVIWFCFVLFLHSFSHNGVSQYVPLSMVWTTSARQSFSNSNLLLFDCHSHFLFVCMNFCRISLCLSTLVLTLYVCVAVSISYFHGLSSFITCTYFANSRAVLATCGFFAKKIKLTQNRRPEKK